MVFCRRRALVFIRFSGLAMKLILVALFLFALPSDAFALAGEWVTDNTVSARLIAASPIAMTEDTAKLGLELRLADGWHTYWRSPGISGLPPQLDWSRSQTDANNLKEAVLHFPAPRRYSAFGLETVGYGEHVVFPIEAKLRNAGQGLKADLSVDILVCSSICVPKHFDLSLAVPTGSAFPDTETALWQQAQALLPSSPEESGILLKGISSDGQSLTYIVSLRDRQGAPDIFTENDKNIGFSAPAIEYDDKSSTATLVIKPVDTLPEGVTLEKIPMTLTIVNGDHATEIKNIMPAAVYSPPAFAPAKTSVLFALLCALLGGFILNLMPCVLPVLSLKIVSVISHGGGEARAVRLSFLHTAAGIIFSFLVLAIAMVGLNAFGLAMGWGVQFQQPFFLMFLVLLLTFFAANLWGLFEIPLPRFLADTLSETYHPKLAGDFATGAFATLLATPCSAPFLGTAVGFALASGPLEIFAVFLALGFGMALPYFAVALFPRAATLLPKPGAWMIRLRQILGVAIALTALWLLWILAAQITAVSALGFGLMMAAIHILLALKKRGIHYLATIALIVLACVLAVFVGAQGALKPKEEAPIDRLWMAYDPMSLKADIAEGKTVFLDVTADWCLTCRANMKFALSNGAVAQRLFHSDVIAMQANWTNPNPEVAELLHAYGRYGIPFNIVFGPQAPQGIVLPELLTPKIVLDAIDEAASQKDGFPLARE